MSNLSSRIPVKLVTSLALVVAAVLLAGLAVQSRLDLATLQGLIAPLLAERDRAPIVFALLYFAAYTAACAFCIPLEVPFALGAGALFGLAGGVVLSSFASIFGATIAFLGARHLLRDCIQRRFASQLDLVNSGIARDGAFYLVNMRLLPIVPFPICNVLMGLTTMPTRVFFVVSQVCMLFATIIFVNAGTGLLTLRSFGDILSPQLIGGLAALAALPWLGKAVVRGVSVLRRRQLAVAA